jgi:hypothetical protein
VRWWWPLRSPLLLSPSLCGVRGWWRGGTAAAAWWCGGVCAAAAFGGGRGAPCTFLISKYIFATALGEGCFAGCKPPRGNRREQTLGEGAAMGKPSFTERIAALGEALVSGSAYLLESLKKNWHGTSFGQPIITGPRIITSSCICVTEND